MEPCLNLPPKHAWLCLVPMFWIMTHLSNSHAGGAIIHAQLDGCSYVLSRSCVKPKRQADEWPFTHAEPALVAFDWQTHPSCSRWANPDESKVRRCLSKSSCPAQKGVGEGGGGRRGGQGPAPVCLAPEGPYSMAGLQIQRGCLKEVPSIVPASQTQIHVSPV